ncbi:MAG TPA: hypothetical protein VGI42_05730 [Chthoniobacterales bacterium]|jgi:predicted regulator of Ras-like GTPase activity (Roadblock/LC7/MglB family)
MPLPFLSYFKKAKSAEPQKSSAVKPAPIEKPSGERLSKTVMPNITRTIAAQEAYEGTLPSQGAAMAGGPAAAPAPRTIAFGGSPSTAKSRGLPPAVALALAPNIERVISLELADIVAKIPADQIKPIESIDGTVRILLKASEVEKGMASGKPMVALATIYEQAPEIFLRTIPPSNAARIALPFAKVLEQFANIQVRRDQELPQAFPQVETPFLQVALEDNSRFGTTMAPLQTGDLRPLRVDPPTAESFAAAEPEAAVHESFHMAPPQIAPEPAPPPAAEKPASTRIPFKLSPNGTDVPAPESVPASSGPSVPTSFPAAPAPVRIPFTVNPSSGELRAKAEPWMTKNSDEPAAATPEVKIALALKPILEALPPIQLKGDPASVPAEARIEIPFSLVEPQLASGRVGLAPKIFETGLPAQYRGLFDASATNADVMVPLQEVLKNLPAASLRMRPDQEEQEAGEDFVTPFSAKAEEDAKRLKVAGTPVVKPEFGSAVAETPPAQPLADRPLRTPLQVALNTDEKLDGQSVIGHINKIPGVKACAILFGDGLSLAGNLPAEFETGGLCAMAPGLMQKVENHMAGTKLGALRDMTLSGAKAAVTFFMHENLCLAALHANGALAAEVREKLTRVVHELSRKYSHPV